MADNWERFEMAGILILGTDTGVGKTVVSCGIIRLLRDQGIEVGAFKPVATGYPPGQHPDILDLANASGKSYEDIACWEGCVPASPSLVARLEGKKLDVNSIAASVVCRLPLSKFNVVEGAGGVLCPLGPRVTVAELAVELALPCVLVARRCLGTLNHILLSLEACASRGLHVAGVVLNAITPPHDIASLEAGSELARLTEVPILAQIGFQANPEMAMSTVDWTAIGNLSGVKK
jgi:dethiobiotin synthetase